MGILVRDLPSLRLHYELETPTGRHYRWAADEPNSANVPSGGSDSSTMPGGFEQLDVTLARKQDVDYTDLDRLSTIRARGPGGDIVCEARLERTPRTSGDQMAISPSAVGWQAHLDDDKSAGIVYVDRDLTHWQGSSQPRRISVATSGYAMNDPSVPSGSQQLETGFDEANGWDATHKPLSEAWYDAGPSGVGRVRAKWNRLNTDVGTVSPWSWSAYLSDDDMATTTDASGALAATGPGTVDLPTSSSRRWALLQFFYDTSAASVGTNKRFSILWDTIRVYGRHGLTIRGATAADEGLYASDIVTHAVGRWAPLLTINGTVQASSFVVPHLVFLDPTTAGEIVRQATAFSLQDWGVWDNRTFYWAQRGTYGRKWRARIAPAQLSETGPQLDRLWESVIVSYNDVDGSTRTVGPPGSGADTEDADLHDTDPENPANQLGIVRRDLLSMGTSTAAGAIEVGRRFLEEQKLLDTSGQAQLVGHVMDDRGVLHPYWRVRAGDTISFVDAADTSYRRIVRASNDHGSRTCTIDLDAPPEGLDALLARLGVVLVPLGVS